MQENLQPIQISMLESEFIKIILEKLGITIHKHQRQDLIKIIENACQQFKCTPDEYLQMLKCATDKSSLLDHLISRITVGETYFFRDKAQMELLYRSILPQIITNKRSENNLSLRIWSAGCSSGEEIYTVAMLLLDLIPDIKNWIIKLLGTDINPEALKKAIHGHYSEWSMRSIPSKYKSQFFKYTDKQYQCEQQILDMVSFDYLNLNEDCFPSINNGTNAQDLIICRNVFIYFENNVIDRIMQRLANSLSTNGVLMLGASDPIIINHVDLVYDSKTGILIKQSKKPVVERETSPIRSKEPASTPSTYKQTHVNTKIPVVKPHTPDLDDLKTIKPAALNARGVALANLGQLKEAQSLFELSIRKDPVNKDTYFLYALTLAELENSGKCEEMLRKAIFLDNEFVAAHYQLGILLLKLKKPTPGLRFLKNALAISKQRNSTDAVTGYDNLTYGRLTEILDCEIDIHSNIGHEADAY